jgi:hypothetical protein
LWKFIVSFSTVVAPLHTIIVSGKSFYLGKNQHNSFYEIKIKIYKTTVRSLPKFQNPFEVETYASGYSMGEVLMQ